MFCTSTIPPYNRGDPSSLRFSYLQRVGSLGHQDLLWLIRVAAQYERMATSRITYPRVVSRDVDPPRGLSGSYVGLNVVGSLPFKPFTKTPTRSQWIKYRSWVSKQLRKAKKGGKNDILGVVEGVQLTEECLFTLSPTEWLNDAVIQAGIKSILNSNPLESSVGFLPTFFYTKLMNNGNENPKREGCYEYEGVRNWFKKTFGEEKKVSDMSTLVILQNQHCSMRYLNGGPDVRILQPRCAYNTHTGFFGPPPLFILLIFSRATRCA